MPIPWQLQYSSDHRRVSERAVFVWSRLHTGDICRRIVATPRDKNPDQTPEIETRFRNWVREAGQIVGTRTFVGLGSAPYSLKFGGELPVARRMVGNYR
jgi:hypothetical protein